MGCGSSKPAAVSDMKSTRNHPNSQFRGSNLGPEDASFRPLRTGEQYPHVEEFRKRFHIVKCIGSGKYGAVHLVERRNDKKEFAVKAIRRPDEDKHAGRKGPPEEIQNEIELLSHLKHSNILSIRGVFEEEEGFVLLLDFSAGGDLYRALKKSHKGVWSEKKAAKTLIDILCGLCFLHSQSIAHRDLKPENVLLVRSPQQSLPPCGDKVATTTAQMEQLDLKRQQEKLWDNPDEHIPIVLADFGFAKKSTSEDPLKTFCGSPLYIAPEIIRSRYGLYHTCKKVDGGWVDKDTCRHCLADVSGTVSSVPKENRKPYTPICDVWSAGILLFEVLYGYTPFAAKGSNGTLRNVLKGKFEFPDAAGAKSRISAQGHIPMKKLLLNIKTSDSVKELISKMLAYEAEERCTAAEALACNWFGQEGVIEYRDMKLKELVECLESCPRSPEVENSLSVLRKVLAARAMAASTLRSRGDESSARLNMKEPSFAIDPSNTMASHITLPSATSNKRGGNAFFDDETGSVVLSTTKSPAAPPARLPDVSSDVAVTKVKVKNGGVVPIGHNIHSSSGMDNPPRDSMSKNMRSSQHKLSPEAPPRTYSGESDVPKKSQVRTSEVNVGDDHEHIVTDSVASKVPFGGFVEVDTAPLGESL
eukprot:CAMPEP_0113901336 /NCGR_PEP_ID=MMETSP0780_2-20120614/21194_1 /TAXON_ID=652834 /ORGANISM="Palpitomonas bilix" /LENGTH=644 /DNA_ID=CAMNT_0000893931 /DNA_START=415 /DNA_END=2349 /DNA_ORIENTATION=+ /assembly_acc=CAM_ASM_000599